MRSGGKTMRTGEGGLTLNSHHNAGRAASAASAQGTAKLKAPRPSILSRSDRSGQSEIESEQRDLRRLIGAVGERCPTGVASEVAKTGSSKLGPID